MKAKVKMKEEPEATEWRLPANEIGFEGWSLRQRKTKFRKVERQKMSGQEKKRKKTERKREEGSKGQKNGKAKGQEG